MILVGVLASAADGITFPVISVFMGELFEVHKKINSSGTFCIIYTVATISFVPL